MPEQIAQLKKLLMQRISAVLEPFEGLSTSADAIATQLAGEITASLRQDAQGRAYAPDQYTLSLNPQEADIFQGQGRSTQSRISRALMHCLEETGYLIAREPHITLATDPTLANHEVRIIAWHSSDPLQFSAEISPETAPAEMKPPKGAFVIVEGKRHFPLSRNEIRIGRRLDNHLILDDPHVSRSHASIEAIEGHYYIIDNESTAGTRVNGRLIRRHRLRPGDIISIAAVQLIYGEDTEGPPHETPPYEPKPDQDKTWDQITPLGLGRRQDKLTRPYNQKDQA